MNTNQHSYIVNTNDYEGGLLNDDPFYLNKLDDKSESPTVRRQYRNPVARSTILESAEIFDLEESLKGVGVKELYTKCPSGHFLKLESFGPLLINLRHPCVFAKSGVSFLPRPFRNQSMNAYHTVPIGVALYRNDETYGVLVTGTVVLPIGLRQHIEFDLDPNRDYDLSDLRIIRYQWYRKIRWFATQPLAVEYATRAATMLSLKYTPQPHTPMHKENHCVDFTGWTSTSASGVQWQAVQWPSGASTTSSTIISTANTVDGTSTIDIISSWQNV